MKNTEKKVKDSSELYIEEITMDEISIMEEGIQPGGGLCGIGCIAAGVWCGLGCPK